MISAAKSPLDHIFNDHKYCGDWCLAVKAKKKGNVNSDNFEPRAQNCDASDAFSLPYQNPSEGLNAS